MSEVVVVSCFKASFEIQSSIGGTAPSKLVLWLEDQTNANRTELSESVLLPVLSCLGPQGPTSSFNTPIHL
jgi:hypothetical protein